jgi:hypothetical protein
MGREHPGVRFAAACLLRLRRQSEGDIYVQSAAHRSVTVVTVMTLVFTPMLQGNHWVDVLTGRTTETHTEQCQPGDPCPAQKHITQKIVLKP